MSYGGGKSSTDINSENNYIKVVLFPANGDPTRKSVKGSLEDLQALVGGLIEPVRLEATYGNGDLKTMLRAFGVEYKSPLGLVNEEGLLYKLPRNKWFPQYVGDVVVMENSDLK